MMVEAIVGAITCISGYVHFDIADDFASFGAVGGLLLWWHCHSGGYVNVVVYGVKISRAFAECNFVHPSNNWLNNTLICDWLEEWSPLL